MYDMREKVILVDCDGVLCDWVFSYNQWMKLRGYEMVRNDNYDLAVCYGMDKEEKRKIVRIFNESSAVGWMPPFRDAIKYVKKLHEEEGFIFHCITSLSLEPTAYRLREKNLARLFGDTAFDRLVCLDTGADKDDALAEYKDTNCVWVEDKPENAVAGVNAGLDSLLLVDGHSQDFHAPGVTRVNSWRDIYNHIKLNVDRSW